MKRRNITYLRKNKAQRIMSNIMDTDLMTFLNATMQLCKSAVVKMHVKETLNELEHSTSYRLTA